MNAPIIFQNIASFLDAETLLAFGEVCKLFHKISILDDCWEKLFKLRYTSDLELYG